MRITEVTYPFQDKSIDIGLMTLDEFKQFKNPKGIWHGSNAYDFDLAHLNQDYSDTPIFKIKDFQYSKNELGYRINKGNNVVGIIHNGILYHTQYLNPKQVPTKWEDDYYGINAKTYDLSFNNAKLVKYIDDYAILINPIRNRNLKRFPILMNTFKQGNDVFTIRTEQSPYKENSGKIITILNSDGFVVGFASDEFGATLVTVAKEYRNKGLGKILANLFYKYNPKYTSGGFTSRGLANAIATWESIVRKYLENGWYSELVKSGKITKERVREIIAGLSPRKKPKNKPAGTKTKSILIHFDDYEFIIYDRDFYNNPNEDNVYGFGFFRETSNKMYLYAIDYDKEFKKLSNYCALQIMRNHDEPLYIKTPPSSPLEFEDLDGVTIKDDFAFLTKDVLDIPLIKHVESSYRKKHDKYSEFYYQLKEIANSKWE